MIQPCEPVGFISIGNVIFTQDRILDIMVLDEVEDLLCIEWDRDGEIWGRETDTPHLARDQSWKFHVERLVDLLFAKKAWVSVQSWYCPSLNF